LATDYASALILNETPLISTLRIRNGCTRHLLFTLLTQAVVSQWPDLVACNKALVVTAFL